MGYIEVREGKGGGVGVEVGGGNHTPTVCHCISGANEHGVT